ncbi:hypothetical protein [Paraferrimonas sp. SM1919]|uniref:DUF7009 family protein n=1 Tax=Paraferrimonas sp. SM1919 TaxID=2662263 RepID=UPI0013D8D9D1|nr:hypothetical protein [Paraferrimonas sp. SM1919]
MRIRLDNQSLHVRISLVQAKQLAEQGLLCQQVIWGLNPYHLQLELAQQPQKLALMQQDNQITLQISQAEFEHYMNQLPTKAAIAQGINIAGQAFSLAIDVDIRDQKNKRKQGVS